MTAPRVCDLCGHTDARDLKYGLVRHPKRRPEYTHGYKCRDTQACRLRRSKLEEFHVDVD